MFSKVTMEVVGKHLITIHSLISDVFIQVCNNNNNNNNNNRFTQAHNSLTVNVLGALCSPLKQSIIVQKDGF